MIPPIQSPAVPEAPKKRKKSAVSPTQRSLKMLRADGWTVAIVEHWNSFCHIRQDLFGFIDLLCLRGGETLAVQTTVGGEVARRIAKIADLPVVAEVRKAAWKIEVHGWRKLATGKWECRVVDIS